MNATDSRLTSDRSGKRLKDFLQRIKYDQWKGWVYLAPCIALLLVFFVVIFFWMAFHQNGSALTFFAKKYTNLTIEGPMRFGFNIFSLALVAVSVYTGFSAIQSKVRKTKSICSVLTIVLLGCAYGLYSMMENPTMAQPSDFQQFNPFFVVALTPFSMILFDKLGKRGHEISAPTRIAWGMFVAAIGFGVITMASTGLISPMDGINPEDININSLVRRVENDNVKEVIVVLKPSIEGETTMQYIKKFSTNV